jgi:long-chain acyl-CoA synthetase
MSVNLAALLTASAGRGPERPALKLDDTVLTYGQLDEASARVAGLLRARGIGAGDRVGVMLPNVPSFAVAYYGILRAGGVVVPMNVLLKTRETASTCRTRGRSSSSPGTPSPRPPRPAPARPAPSACSSLPASSRGSWPGPSPRREVAERDGGDTAVILYTSGTTGTPKGAELTHDNLRRNTETMAELFRFGPDTGHPRRAAAVPLVRADVRPERDAPRRRPAHARPALRPGKALEIIQRDRVTVFEGVPTMYARCSTTPRRTSFDTSTLQICASGGAALPVEVLHGFEESFDCKVLEGYGLSETSPVASFTPPDGERKAGAIGIPIPGVEMKVVDDDGNDVPQGEVGEIVIRGHNVMKGYWGRDDATRETIRDGWLHSGDMARIDEDGYFFIVDRKKDLIIRGGYNVYPREVEEVLYEHPAVREAAVVGMPHPELGEEIGAAVALKDGQEATPEELQAHVKDAVAAYKYPRMVWLVDELPKGPTGKILKREIAPPANRQA